MTVDTRVLVVSADSHASNYGIRALAAGHTRLAHTAFGEHVQVDLQGFGPGDSEIAFGLRSIARDVGRRNGPIAAKLRRYAAVLESGAGDSFSDIYGLRRLLTMVYVHARAYSLGIPVIFMPQTIGPFHTVAGRRIARWTLRRAHTVISRDTASARYAREVLGVPVSGIASDVVFLVDEPSALVDEPPVDEPPGDESPAPPRAHDVSVNVSGLLWVENRHVDHGTYRRATRELVRSLQARGRHVTLLAHVVDSPAGHDDADAVREYTELFPGDGVDILVPHGLTEARAQLASARLVIGARMHACLNAISVGVPAVAWAYSRKFKPLLEDLGWYAVADLREPERVVAQTQALLAHEDRLTDDVRVVREHARNRLTETAALLGGRLTETVRS
jgi:polysaccharide pyruvyl transferase WcaK-like protein